MVKFFCDKCGKEFDPMPAGQRYGTFFKIKMVTNDWSYAHDQDVTSVHLCNKCQEALRKFIFADENTES